MDGCRSLRFRKRVFWKVRILSALQIFHKYLYTTILIHILSVKVYSFLVFSTFSFLSFPPSLLTSLFLSSYCLYILFLYGTIRISSIFCQVCFVWNRTITFVKFSLFISSQISVLIVKLDNHCLVTVTVLKFNVNLDDMWLSKNCV